MVGIIPKIRVFYIAFISILLLLPIVTSAQIECENVPASNGAPSQQLIDLCRLPVPNKSFVGTEATGDVAIGWEFVSRDLDTLELVIPEVLNPLGITKYSNGETDFISGCDFDNSETFQELYCISEEGAFLSMDVDLKILTGIGDADPFNNEGFTGLATDPTTGIMYASSNDLSNSSIYTLDISSGEATRIGEVTNSPGLIAIAINNQGQMFGVDIIFNSLIKINKSNGAGTVVGSLGFDANFAQGMDFNESDNECYLFAFNNVSFRPELRTCNTITGLTQLVGVLGDTFPGETIQITGAGIAATAPEISILPITPGSSNSINSMNAEGTSPSGNVAFVWGNGPGSLKIGGKVCNGLEIGMKNPKLIGIVKADPDQTAVLNFLIPFFSEPEIEIYSQAVDVRSCVTSEVIPNTITGANQTR